MAEIKLKKLSRSELLEMMIKFSEESEQAAAHEKQLEEQYEKEKSELLEQMAQERLDLLQQFNAEKAEMRKKFGEQKMELQSRFEQDMKGLKARLEREKVQTQAKVKEQLDLIDQTGSIADASVSLSGVMKAAQEAADMYIAEIRRRTTAEIDDFHNEMNEARARSEAMEQETIRKCKQLEAKTIKACEQMLEQAKEESAANGKQSAKATIIPITKTEVQKQGIIDKNG